MSNASVNRRHRTGGKSAIQTFTAVTGIVFLVVGIAGFIPGLTTNYDQLQLASHDSEATLLGLFQVSILHNVVHLLFGVVGLLAARSARPARLYLVLAGIAYLVLFVYGVVVPHDSMANFVPVNAADNVLHVVLAVVMISAGLALSRTRAGVPVEATDRP